MDIFRRVGVGVSLLGILLLGILLLGILASGCGVQPRPVKGRGDPSQEQIGPRFRDPPKTEAQDSVSFEAAGFLWTVRSARARTGAHPSSAWELGLPAVSRFLVEGGVASAVDPLAWPDEPESILMLQIHGVRSGDWWARCILADQSAEESLPPSPLEWDAVSESALVPLSRIFGSRGERRDPASVCHVLVRLTSAAESRVLQVSLRVLAGLPTPEPVEREEFAWSTTSAIRGEVWKNSGFRNLVLELGAQSRLMLTSTVEQQGFVQMTPRHPKRPSGPVKRFYSRTKAIEVQARVQPAPGAGWSDWIELPLQLQWPAGSELRVEYRLAPSSGGRVCGLPDLEVRRIPMSAIVWGVQQTRRAQHFQGGVAWKSRVLDPAKLRAGAEPRSSTGEDFREAEPLAPVPEGSPFDCQGWVP